MKKHFNLGNHSINDLAQSTNAFFSKTLGMNTQMQVTDKRCIINAATTDVDISDKFMGGDMKCYVDIVADGAGGVSVEAKKDNWLGMIGAGITIIGGAACLPAKLLSLGVLGLLTCFTGENVIKQIIIPAKVCKHVEAYLAQ